MMPPVEILFSEEQIRSRTARLAEELTAFYRGRPLTAVILLNGGLFFAADLLRSIRLPLQVDTLSVSSYENDRSSGKLSIRAPLKLSPEGRHLLLIDDILDTGLTLAKTIEFLQNAGAASVRACVLLDKILPPGQSKLASCDWYGFRVPNHYVVGFGLDSGERFRNLPWIGKISPGKASSPRQAEDKEQEKKKES